MEHRHDQNDHTCCSSNFGVQQSFGELEFERGIWYAAQYNDLDRVKTLLSNGVAATMQDSAGYTALHYAARNGHTEICRTLLENGAAVNAKTRCGRATALHRAASQCHLRVVELLLMFGANPDLKDADDHTPLHRAIMARSTPVCKVLLSCTNLKLLSNDIKSIDQLAKDEFPDILPLLSKHVNPLRSGGDPQSPI